MADSIFDFDPIAGNNTLFGGTPFGPNQLYHNQIDNLFRAYAGALGGFVDDLGAVATPTGTATAIAVTLSQGFTGYGTAAGEIRHGTLIALKMPLAATAAATLAVNAIAGTKKIRRQGDAAIEANDWLANGVYFFRYDTAYDTANGAWVLMNAASSGVTYLTNAEAVTGTSLVKSANANNLSAVRARRNRLVNPAMQISSVNGNASGTANGYVPADNWATYRVTSAGTITTQRVQSVTPKGAKDRIRVTITAADASLAAGEYLTVTQAIVGQEIADFQYGSGSAKQSVLRFLFKGPAGTYAVALHNEALNRSYVALFTPAVANTDEIISLVIPGDSTGTWTTSTTTGLTLDIVLACGSTFQGTTGWQSGNILGTSGVSNGMGTISQVFEIGEAGFHLDPESTGVAPVWELPSYREDQVATGAGGLTLMTVTATTSGTVVDWTGIPATAKQITISFAGVSTNGSANYVVQIGDSGGIENTSYVSLASTVGGTIATSSGSFIITSSIAAGGAVEGSVQLNLVDPATNTWVESGVLSNIAGANVYVSGGTKSLSATLDRVRFTSGDTLDAGKVNLSYQ